MSARLARAVGALSDPNERLFDCSPQTTVGSVQLNLQLGFRIGIRLVNEVAL